jgi:hypothetical protein
MRAGLLLVPCLVVACGDNIHFTNELVNVDPEPEGANCKYGGVVITTGTDTNHDGVLDGSEVTSTNYVCNGSNAVVCEGGTIHKGTVTVQSSADFAALAGVNCIDGDLIITSVPDMMFPALSDLSIVTGSVVVAANPAVTSLDALTSLRKVGSGIAVEANQALASVGALSGLMQFQSVSIIANASLADLSGFESFADLHSSDLVIQSNPSLTSLHGLDNLTDIHALVVHSNAALLSLDALAQLRTANTVDVGVNASLPSLTLPALQTITVRLLINQNASLTTVTLPALTSLSDGIQCEGNGALDTIDMPALVLIGNLIFLGDVSLTRISAPNLTFTTADLILNTLPMLTSVDFGHLSTLGGELQLWNVGSLADLTGFAAVTSLGGDLIVIGCNSLANFDGLGPIAAVPGNMTVSANAQLTSFSGLSAMTEVGGNLLITSNPNLPLSVAQTFASGITVRGTTTIQ